MFFLQLKLCLIFIQYNLKISFYLFFLDEENSYFIFDVARKMAIESEKFHNISASGSKSNTTSSACKGSLSYFFLLTSKSLQP